jgi:hypothetical protein
MNRTIALFDSMEELAAASSVKDGNLEIDYKKAGDTIEAAEGLCIGTRLMVREDRETIAIVNESDIMIDQEFLYIDGGTAIITDALAIMPGGGVLIEYEDDYSVIPADRVVGPVISRIDVE